MAEVKEDESSETFTSGSLRVILLSRALVVHFSISEDMIMILKIL